MTDSDSGGVNGHAAAASASHPTEIMMAAAADSARGAAIIRRLVIMTETLAPCWFTAVAPRSEPVIRVSIAIGHVPNMSALTPPSRPPRVRKSGT